MLRFLSIFVCIVNLLVSSVFLASGMRSFLFDVDFLGVLFPLIIGCLFFCLSVLFYCLYKKAQLRARQKRGTPPKGNQRNYRSFMTVFRIVVGIEYLRLLLHFIRKCFYYLSSPLSRVLRSTPWYIDILASTILLIIIFGILFGIYSIISHFTKKDSETSSTDTTC